MEELRIKSSALVENQEMGFKRSLYRNVDWTNRLIGIMGARGSGKTTILLQRMREAFHQDETAIYLQKGDSTTGHTGGDGAIYPEY